MNKRQLNMLAQIFGLGARAACAAATNPGSGPRHSHGTAEDHLRVMQDTIDYFIEQDNWACSSCGTRTAEDFHLCPSCGLTKTATRL